MKTVISKIKVRLPDGRDFELSFEDAEILYGQLSELFKGKPNLVPSPILPNPYPVDPNPWYVPNPPTWAPFFAHPTYPIITCQIQG